MHARSVPSAVLGEISGKFHKLPVLDRRSIMARKLLERRNEIGPTTVMSQSVGLEGWQWSAPAHVELFIQIIK